MPKKPAPSAAALSNAERQREYRERNAAGRINLVIDPGAKKRLIELADANGVTIRRALEILIGRASSLK